MCPPPCAPARGQVRTLAQLLPSLPGFFGQENGTRAPPALSSENCSCRAETQLTVLSVGWPLWCQPEAPWACPGLGLPGVRGARRRPAGGDTRRWHKLVAGRGVL